MCSSGAGPLAASDLRPFGPGAARAAAPAQNWWSSSARRPTSGASRRGLHPVRRAQLADAALLVRGHPVRARPRCRGPLVEAGQRAAPLGRRRATPEMAPPRRASEHPPAMSSRIPRNGYAGATAAARALFLTMASTTRPDVARQVVPHAGDCDELGVGDRSCGCDAAAEQHQRIVPSVDHHGGDSSRRTFFVRSPEAMIAVCSAQRPPLFPAREAAAAPEAAAQAEATSSPPPSPDGRFLSAPSVLSRGVRPGGLRLRGRLLPPV
jgi:hypothetical protein